MKWSVIIPTLWKPATFPALLKALNNSSFVDEIILIDNNPSALSQDALKFHKIRHLPQSRNIFVNPAWNLGAAEAKNEWLCICNDDVLFDCNAVFGHFKNEMLNGIVGVHPDSFDEATWNDGRPRKSDEVHIKQMWACILFLNQRSYRQIPEEMKIWWGDAWLAWYARPASSIITKVITKHSESVDSPQFNPITERDTELWVAHFKPAPVRAIEWKTALLNRIQSKLRRTLHQA